jgi:hypothetical protein
MRVSQQPIAWKQTFILFLVTDKGLVHITKLPNLNRLALDYVYFTDAGLILEIPSGQRLGLNRPLLKSEDRIPTGLDPRRPSSFPRKHRRT